jgi:predicted nuclease of predicted toxin-antitoxin system
MLRFLANENFPGDAVKALTRIGHDVAWILKAAPGSSDEEVLKRAMEEERILITFDKDFGELAFKRGLAGIMWNNTLQNSALITSIFS